jgi:hypothetical protein
MEAIARRRRGIRGSPAGNIFLKVERSAGCPRQDPSYYVLSTRGAVAGAKPALYEVPKTGGSTALVSPEANEDI